MNNNLYEKEIKFPLHQKLPNGYKVIWFEGDEHYHWIDNDSGSWGDGSSSRWQSWRGAWERFRKKLYIKI